MSIIFSLLFSLFSFGSDAPSVHLKENIYVNEPRAILFSDIASFVNIDDFNRSLLEKLVVSADPKEFKKLQRHQLLKKIKHFLVDYEKYCDCRVQIIVSQSQEAVAFDLNSVKEKLKEKLNSECQQCLFQLADLKIVRGKIPDQYKFWSLQDEVFGLKGLSTILIYFDNEPLQPLVLQTMVQVQRPVVVLKKTILKGASLTNSDFEVQLREITNENKNFAEFGDLVGKELKRSVSKGQLITLEDLIDKQSVRLGQPVAIEMSQGAIFLEMSGTAQKNGKIGERIPVRVNKTQKQVMAEVIGDSRVRL